MGKQTFDKTKKILSILIVIFFVISMTFAVVNAAPGTTKTNDKPKKPESGATQSSDSKKNPVDSGATKSSNSKKTPGIGSGDDNDRHRHGDRDGDFDRHRHGDRDGDFDRHRHGDRDGDFDRHRHGDRDYR
jgi:preprotein translocase subunit SecG